MTAPGPTGGTPRPRGRPRPTARDAELRWAVQNLAHIGQSLTVAYATVAQVYGLTPATVRQIVTRGRRSEAPPTPPAAPHGAIAAPGDPDPR